MIKMKKEEIVIEPFKAYREDIQAMARCYARVFRGAPWYENWTNKLAKREISAYIESGSTIFRARRGNETLGFCITEKEIPLDQRIFFPNVPVNTPYLAEIGVDPRCQRLGIGSKFLAAIGKMGEDYLAYRTNGINTVTLPAGYCFGSDPKLDIFFDLDFVREGRNPRNKLEKQQLMNRYVRLVCEYPKLDQSYLNCTARSVYGESVRFCMRDKENVAFSEDPNSFGNNRVFLTIGLKERKLVKGGK